MFKKLFAKNKPEPVQQAVHVLFEDTGTELSLRFGNAQHIGLRDDQQDSFGFSDISDAEKIAKKGVLAVVADGMGGLENGKQVSDYVMRALLTMFEQLDYTVDIPAQLEHMVQVINDEVCARFAQSGKHTAGSTLVAALMIRSKLYWVSVGDSRLYLLRRGALYQLNEDHDYQNQLLTGYIRGTASLEQARTDPQKDALTSFIGNSKLPLIDGNKIGFALQREDKLVLCSDGIYNALKNAELIELLALPPQNAADKIIQAVLEQHISGQDNMSIMILEYN